MIGRPLRAGVMALVAIGLIAAAGCGRGPQSSDQFVGTWVPVGAASGSGDVARLVITKGTSGYSWALASNGVSNGWWRIERHGDELDGTYPGVEPNGSPSGATMEVRIVYHAGSGRLTWKDNGGMRITFTKASTSTAVPSPQGSRVDDPGGSVPGVGVDLRGGSPWGRAGPASHAT